MKLAVSVCPSPAPLIPLITWELRDQLQGSLTEEGGLRAIKFLQPS